MKFVRIGAFLLTLLLSGALYAQPGDTLIVFAASSLTDAFEELAADFEAAHPGVEVLFNFAGSSDLAAQLAEGAPADVFASANQRQMDMAQLAGRIRSARRVFAQNRLALIVPADNPANIQDLGDLMGANVQIIVAARNVPVRDYTDAMLQRMEGDPRYGIGYRLAFVGNVVSEESNVRQVTAKIALGEADAGIVYVSDVTPDLRAAVTLIPIPDEFNTITSYPIAVTHDSENRALARAFVRYVLSNAGQNTLACWNFIPVRDRGEPECGAA